LSLPLRKKSFEAIENLVLVNFIYVINEQFLHDIQCRDANQHVFAVFSTIFVTKYGNTIFMLQIRFLKIQNCARVSDKLERSTYAQCCIADGEAPGLNCACVR